MNLAVGTDGGEQRVLEYLAVGVLAAKILRQLFAQPGERYPELAPHFEEGVAIDGAVKGPVFP